MIDSEARADFPSLAREEDLEGLPLAIFLVIVLAAVVRLIGLGDQSFWVDEYLTLYQGTVPGHGLLEQFLDDYHSPLPMVCAALIGRLSHDEFFLRLPTALLAVATVPLLFVFVRRWLGGAWGARAGLVSALMLALHPFHLYHSQELRGYAWLLFFGLAAAVVAQSGRRGLGTGRALGLAALGVGAVLSNLQGLVWMAGLALFAATAGWVRRRDLGRWILAFGLVAALSAPWWTGPFQTHATERLLPHEETGEPLRGETTFNVWSLPYAGFALSAGPQLGPPVRELHRLAASGEVGLPQRYQPLVGGVGALVLVLGVAGLLRLGRRRSLALFLWVAPVVALALVLAARNVKPFNPRYVIAALPAVVIVLAVGVTALPRRAAVALLAAWILFAAVGIYRYHFDPDYARDDVRGAARLVEERQGDEDFVLAPTVNGLFLWYYGGGLPVLDHWGHPEQTAASVAQRLDELEPERRYCWYVRCRPWHDDPEGFLLAAFENGWRRRAAFSLPGVDVLLYERRAGD
jgi:hypothetical protein